MGKEDMERRFFQVDDLRIESRGEGDEKTELITGYAAVFDKWSQDLGGFREKIKYGAFRKAIRDDDVRALKNHDPNFILGRNKSGTLHLEERKKGLYFEINPPDTPEVNSLKESIKRGDIDGNSFSFIPHEDGDVWDFDKSPAERTLTSVRLFDVGPVTFPAYPQTSVAVRDLIKSKQEEREQAETEDRTDLQKIEDILKRNSEEDDELTTDDHLVISNFIDELRNLLPEAEDRTEQDEVNGTPTDSQEADGEVAEPTDTEAEDRDEIEILTRQLELEEEILNNI